MLEIVEQSSADKDALDRFVFVSDAVFAIAITLLALELRVREMPIDQVAAQMPRELEAMTPKFISFILSFLIIGSYWAAHHRDFQYIKRYDQRLIWIILLLLMFVAFLPFPTAMLGNYPAQQFTVTLYAGCLALMGFVRAWLWWYASRNYRLIDRELDPRRIARLNRRGLIVPLIFLLSIVFAIFNPLVAMWSWTRRRDVRTAVMNGCFDAPRSPCYNRATSTPVVQPTD
jgi:uncharacterized membrane protein